MPSEPWLGRDDTYDEEPLSPMERLSEGIASQREAIRSAGLTGEELTRQLAKINTVSYTAADFYATAAQHFPSVAKPKSDPGPRTGYEMVAVHHTSAPSAYHTVVVKGRPDLPGPLANVMIDASGETWHVQPDLWKWDVGQPRPTGPGRKVRRAMAKGKNLCVHHGKPMRGGHCDDCV